MTGKIWLLCTLSQINMLPREELHIKLAIITFLHNPLFFAQTIEFCYKIVTYEYLILNFCTAFRK